LGAAYATAVSAMPWSHASNKLLLLDERRENSPEGFFCDQQRWSLFHWQIANQRLECRRLAVNTIFKNEGRERLYSDIIYYASMTYYRCKCWGSYSSDWSRG
jgi:hypothetical protein